MNRIVLASMILLFAPATISAQEVELESNLQRFSYALGLRVGASLRSQGLDELDTEALAAAVKDVLSGAKMRLTPDEMEAARKAYGDEIQAKRQAAASENQKAGESFLQTNRDAEGVTVTPSGLQYKVVRAGTGEAPKSTDTVVVHYRGKLLDGTEFDSSYRRDEPTELGLNAVIPGWQEVLGLMQEGAIYEVWIPSQLAYGANGAGRIGPNSTLHFDIELINIKK